ncbi:gluconeogenesis factor YvcK family protein [Aeromonas media]|uniref:Putative gluconeogenesis factor n=1 Tax=Aeromonas media TaxID=651 RepID=A0AAW5REU8_AERME|nr:uridine diphosphate-N-acetylglucosamine-binding protein YvcK [Aeromonas media]MBS4638441.1 uridine diphosphate-N-acetylglucosamine-binding protein YvcK [Aeromonas media]MCV3286827.1 uridine diphosphate-N-acetylglucosamine-binding protein YvcK [Aeromonas media]MDM5075438.1 uridine diphosphate-N-acetylglucosamine-binding protein YvcK [Aeromonas media]QJT34150.1 uridine diphosphate-N-acetylglucosamine-binding protein YvcK [Aeromonas media]QJT39727.1 uridine diphosphate-N-acetylglucosamine-bind
MWQKNINDFERVVAIGGGHGMGRVLSSLSFLGTRLTGIVTTTDNGGSTGRLRKSQECIAWGDLRNCLNQLVTEPSIGSRLFEYRFTGRGELAGHNLGNLMLLALDNLCVRPLDAIRLISDMLNIEPSLLPMSEHPTDLCAHTVCGDQILGEVSIDQLTTPPRALSLNPVVPATREAIDALNQADMIILGPGSFLTSIMPPLLLNEVAEAIRGSGAIVVFISNLVAENGPAGKLTLSHQHRWLEERIGQGRIDAILAPEGHGAPELQHCLVQASLGEAALPHRHDRLKLRQALDAVILSWYAERDKAG